MDSIGIPLMKGGPMERLLLLWQVILKEFGDRFGICTMKDYQTVLHRVECEGLSFLTITLPSFGKAFERSLDLGKWDPSFTVFRRKGELPLFLGGFLDLIFDRSDGVLRDDPDVESIFAIRQLTLMFAKILVPCAEHRVKGAINGYITCEQEIEKRSRNIADEARKDFTRVATLLFAEAFSKLDRDILHLELLPRHGPGATADKLTGNRKYYQRVWPQRLERTFPYGEFALPNWRYWEYLDDVDFLEPGAELPVRVITVPKTLKTPRIIAIEPTAMQYMQQAISRRLVEYLEEDYLLHGMVGFSQQEPNQLLAEEGSIFGQLATLDLSEASDRVSNQHVADLTSHFPHLFEGFQATRSVKADVPGYGIISLSKFASMGSALCFPVEACVFLSLAFLGIEDGLNRRLTPRDIKSFWGKVRVYGDDIIVPVDYVHLVCRRLESFGFKVNGGKSFWTGKFRESCGKDYYDGHDVTPVRVRRMIPTRRADILENAEDCISLVSLRNQLYFVGLWRSTAYVDGWIESLFGGAFPIVECTSPVLGRHSVSFGYLAEDTHVDYHSPLVKGYVVVSKPPPSVVDGVFALVKWFLKDTDEPFVDKNHLERQGRPDAVRIKLRKASPF